MRVTFAAVACACALILPLRPAVAASTPHISQSRPAGRDASWRGNKRCGAAVMAMVWRSHGVEPAGPAVGPVGLVRGAKRLTDAQLVSFLDAGDGRQNESTRTVELQRLAQLIGLKSRVTKTPDKAWLLDALRRGEQVIATGDAHVLDWPNHGAHYVLLNGLTRDGRVEVHDPARDTTTFLSADQVTRFAQTHGGYLMGLAR